MTKAFFLAALTMAVALAAYGCQDDTAVDPRTSALSSCGGMGAPGDSSGVRGFTQANGTHLAVFRGFGTSAITEVTGTPLANPVNLGGSVLARSTPWAYRRHDGANAAVYVATNQHIHEMGLPAGTDVDLTVAFGINAPLAAGAPPSGPSPEVIGYVRSDNRSAMVYRGSNNHVIEIISNFGSQPPWLANDLTVLAGALVTATKGSAFPYVRSDGTNSIVYIASDNHIHELSGSPSHTVDADLYGSGVTVVPGSDPWGYVRSDGYNSVLFVATDSTLQELFLFPGGTWGRAVLPAVSPGNGLARRPSGYVRADGVNAVAYVSNDREIHELELGPSGWSDVTLRTCLWPVAPLFAHVTGTTNSILFQATDITITRRYELSSTLGGGWTTQSF